MTFLKQLYNNNAINLYAFMGAEIIVPTVYACLSKQQMTKSVHFCVTFYTLLYQMDRSTDAGWPGVYNAKYSIDYKRSE